MLSTLLLLGLLLGLLGLRLLAAPTGEGIRIPLAAGPDGSAYVAAAGRGLVQLDSSGGARVLGALPTSSPRSLAFGLGFLLGADDGLFTSPDGRTWKRAAVPGRGFLAVAASGGRLAAAAWAGGLWLSDDAGAAWRRTELPAGFEEVTSISLGSLPGEPDLAGSLTGVAVSAGGAWLKGEGIGGRVTALDRGGGDGLVAGTWDGRLYTSSLGTDWARVRTYPAGIWAYSAQDRAAATTEGLETPAGRSLPGSEVTALAYSDGTLYAAVAGSGVLVRSADGGWRRALQL